MMKYPNGTELVSNCGLSLETAHTETVLAEPILLNASGNMEGFLSYWRVSSSAEGHCWVWRFCWQQSHKVKNCDAVTFNTSACSVGRDGEKDGYRHKDPDLGFKTTTLASSPVLQKLWPPTSPGTHRRKVGERRKQPVCYTRRKSKLPKKMIHALCRGGYVSLCLAFNNSGDTQTSVSTDTLFMCEKSQDGLTDNFNGSKHFVRASRHIDQKRRLLQRRSSVVWWVELLFAVKLQRNQMSNKPSGKAPLCKHKHQRRLFFVKFVFIPFECWMQLLLFPVISEYHHLNAFCSCKTKLLFC